MHLYAMLYELDFMLQMAGNAICLQMQKEEERRGNTLSGYRKKEYTTAVTDAYILEVAFSGFLGSKVLYQVSEIQIAEDITPD